MQISAVALSFIIVAVLIVTSSHAAFVAQTDNQGNAITSARLTLTDDDASTAMFTNITGMVANQVIDRCISVTYEGSVDPVPVRLFAPAAPTDDLAPYLDLQIDIGTDADPAFGNCDSFASSTLLYSGSTLADFAATHNGFATGLVAWDPGVGPETRAFRFRLTLQDRPEAANKSTTFGFTWETRSA